jgi:hypothetical protein
MTASRVDNDDLYQRIGLVSFDSQVFDILEEIN